jgi:1-phosphatidylinositol-3-phosphate 5-kinase
MHLQVKCIPFDGISGESCLVDGLVCRKNVAHRRMRTNIKQPRILMLRGALENRRTSTNLSSFDTMLDQV